MAAVTPPGDGHQEALSNQRETVSSLATNIAAAFPHRSTSASVLDLRVTPDAASATYGKAILVDVAIGKPAKAYFWRTDPNDENATALYTLDGSKQGAEGTYAVSPTIVPLIPDHVRLVTIRPVVTSQAVTHLMPIPLPGPDGRWNGWHQSLARAVEMAKTRWIRLSPNQFRGGYDVFEAIGQLPEPQWPAESFEELLEIGFRGRLITSEDHPLIQQLLGVA